MRVPRLVVAMVGAVTISACASDSGAKPERTDTSAVASATTSTASGVEAQATTGAQTQPEISSPPTLAPFDPLGAITFAGSVDDFLSRTARAPGFSSDDVEIVALVSLATVDAAGTVTIAWFRLVDDETREPLFVHEIAGPPGATLFSEAIATGGLAAGVYEVVATSSDESSTGMFVVTGEGGATPVAGGSGVASPTSSSDPEPETGECSPTSVRPLLNPPAVQVYAAWTGTCGSVRLAAGTPAPLVPLEMDTTRAGDAMSAPVPLCAFPGGSDLPGSTVRAIAEIGGQQIEAEATVWNNEHLEIHLWTEFGDGGAVSAGDTIVMRALAISYSPGFGIEAIGFTLDGEVVASGPNETGETEPVPCNPSRFTARLETVFTVPDSPPPTIEVCAAARTFDGIAATPKCVHYNTTETWAGSLTLEFNGNIASSADHVCGGRADFVFEIHVDAAGVVSGDGESSGDPFTCEVDGVDFPGIDPDGTITITGTKSASAFDLQFLQGPGSGCCAAWPGDRWGQVTMEIDADDPEWASVNLTSDNDVGQQWVGLLRIDGALQCDNCSAAAG